MDLLNEQMKAKYFNDLAKQKNIEDLDKVFVLIDEAAKKGEYEVNLPSRIKLTEIQETTLKNLGFEVSEDYPDDGDWNIDWEDVEDDED